MHNFFLTLWGRPRKWLFIPSFCQNWVMVTWTCLSASLHCFGFSAIISPIIFLILTTLDIQILFTEVHVRDENLPNLWLCLILQFILWSSVGFISVSVLNVLSTRLFLLCFCRGDKLQEVEVVCLRDRSKDGKRDISHSLVFTVRLSPLGNLTGGSKL